MIWFNEDKTKMIDLSKIEGFEYVEYPKHSICKTELKLYFHGRLDILDNGEANEVHEILKNKHSFRTPKEQTNQ